MSAGLWFRSSSCTAGSTCVTPISAAEVRSNDAASPGARVTSHDWRSAKLCAVRQGPGGTSARYISNASIAWRVERPRRSGSVGGVNLLTTFRRKVWPGFTLTRPKAGGSGCGLNALTRIVSQKAIRAMPINAQLANVVTKRLLVFICSPFSDEQKFKNSAWAAVEHECAFFPGRGRPRSQGYEIKRWRSALPTASDLELTWSFSEML